VGRNGEEEGRNEEEEEAYVQVCNTSMSLWEKLEVSKIEPARTDYCGNLRWLLKQAMKTESHSPIGEIKKRQ
jgi:CO dehydrogenase/acetyl-CoA synthase beta subunit